MTIDDVIQKYSMNIDDVLNVRAIYNGTITIAPDEHLGDVHRMEPPDAPWPKPTRCNVHFKSVDDEDYNRAMTLFLFLSTEELRTIL